MYITPINNNGYNYSFQANQRAIYNRSGKFLYNTTTYFFRTDLNWDELTSLMCHVFKNVPKVHVYDHACSNGMEAYSFIVQMLHHHPNEAKKFFPVIAKDLTPSNIQIAKKGYIDINDSDFYRIKSQTSFDYDKYFELLPSKDKNHDLAVHPKKILIDNVKFSQGDIFEDIVKMPRSNTILFCRNFWPYLSREKQELLASKLENHFDKTSFVVIGDYDITKANVDDLLNKHGFYEFVGIPGVFGKKNIKS